MTENSPLADLLGIEAVEDSAERAVARLRIREEHKTPTGASTAERFSVLQTIVPPLWQTGRITMGQIRVPLWC